METKDEWNFVIALFFCCFFAAARPLFDKFIFRKLATWLLIKGKVSKKINKDTAAKISKCSESMWKLMYYATAEACILKFIYQEPWFTDSAQYFRGWPDIELKRPVKLYYMCQLGFYIYSIVALLTWETRRKDFAVMMSHHVATVILIGSSYLVRFHRAGAITLALHDASDVFMEAAKVFKYSENEFGASIFFGLFAISWVVLRLIIFPLWVIKSTSYDLTVILNLSKPYGLLLYYLFNTFLLMLLVFHIYWWYLIFNMIMRQLKNRGKVGEDIRSDSDDD